MKGKRSEGLRRILISAGIVLCAVLISSLIGKILSWHNIVAMKAQEMRTFLTYLHTIVSESGMRLTLLSFVIYAAIFAGVMIYNPSFLKRWLANGTRLHLIVTSGAIAALVAIFGVNLLYIEIFMATNGRGDLCNTLDQIRTLGGFCDNQQGTDYLRYVIITVLETSILLFGTGWLAYRFLGNCTEKFRRECKDNPIFFRHEKRDPLAEIMLCLVIIGTVASLVSFGTKRCSAAIHKAEQIEIVRACAHSIITEVESRPPSIRELPVKGERDVPTGVDVCKVQWTVDVKESLPSHALLTVTVISKLPDLSPPIIVSQLILVGN